MDPAAPFFPDLVPGFCWTANRAMNGAIVTSWNREKAPNKAEPGVDLPPNTSDKRAFMDQVG